MIGRGVDLASGAEIGAEIGADIRLSFWLTIVKGIRVRRVIVGVSLNRDCTGLEC